jgi:ABC-type branched-subunit amino acid transport system substrate-binding protein
MVGLRRAFGPLAALLAFSATSTYGQNNGPGVTATEIKIGQTQPYSGPVSAWSIQGRVDLAYMNKINAQGGINGRKIKLISLDDGYSPPKALERARELVESERVLGFFGSVGTTPNIAVAKYLNDRKVPHLLISSGAPRWGDPKMNKWSTPFYILQTTEAQIVAKYLLSTKPDAKVGVLYQNDDYGKGYLKAFRDALGSKADKMIVQASSYDVTDPTVESQIIQLKNSGADTIFNVTTSKFAAQAIRKIADLNWKPLHLAINAVTSVEAVLKPAGLEQSKDIVSLQFMKTPGDPEWANDSGMNEYMTFMKEWAPQEAALDPTAGVSYMMSKITEIILRNCGNDLSRENLLKQATTLQNIELPLLLPGVTVGYAPDDYTPIRKARMTRFNGEKWLPLGDLVSADGTSGN